MASTNVCAPKQGVLYARDSSEESKFYRHNRARLLVWLRYYSDLHEPGYSQGVPDFREKKEMKDYATRKPLPNHVMKRLDDEEAHWCHRILEGAADKLKRKRWRLYEGLLSVYFGEDPSPTILDRLHEEAPDPPAARLALAAHDEAVEFIHEIVERELSRHGLQRLKVIAPWWTPGAKPHPIKPERVAALEVYYEHLEKSDAPMALCKTAEETGYAEESVLAMVQEAERVFTTSLSQHYHSVLKKLLTVDGLRLKELRRERTLSQQDLENMTGVSQETISALEGSKREARHHTVKKLAEALSVEPHELTKEGSNA